jgi:tRNA threonylcarbamoyladenosine biosynthesis protein TsaB
MPDIPQYVLAIETATSKGSLSLLKDGVEIGSWTGGAEKPLSSELLPQIAHLLESAGITLSELGLLVVCSGPGSFTGVRIGLSTAKALQMATGIKAVAVSLLDGMAFSTGTGSLPLVCIVPAGRDEVYWQEFRGRELFSPPKTANINEIVEVFRETPRLCLATKDVKASHIEQIKNSGKKVIEMDDNIARYLAEAALYEMKGDRQPGDPELRPLYIKEFGD